VSEDQDLFALTRTLLLAEEPSLRLVQVRDAVALARSLRDGAPQAAVVDDDLPWADASSLVELLREGNPYLPVLVLTSPRDTEAAAEALRCGASDALPKDAAGYVALPAAIARALEQAEERQSLGRVEARLHTLLDQAGVGFFRSTVEGELVEVNDVLLRLLGAASLTELEELDLPAPYFRRKSRSELLRVMDSSGALQRREMGLPTAAGVVPVALTERLCLDHRGELVVDGLIVDLSERKLVERELAERATQLQRSNQDLQRFAYFASHELQEPLRAIARFARLLTEEEGETLGETGAEGLRFIREGAERMQALVDDLLAFSRVESRAEQLAPWSCQEIAREVLEELSPLIEETRGEVELRSLPVVLGDRSQLLVLFRNLLGNAIKFRGDQPPRITVSARRRDDGWELSVQDNGIGIDPQHCEEIFDAFKRLHRELPGSGIGLAIAKKIVERHGGRIWAESAPGAGSVFRFTLPADGDGAEPVADGRAGRRRRRATDEEAKKEEEPA
jgi:signal transduction histidine kinase